MQPGNQWTFRAVMLMWVSVPLICALLVVQYHFWIFFFCFNSYGKWSLVIRFIIKKIYGSAKKEKKKKKKDNFRQKKKRKKIYGSACGIS